MATCTKHHISPYSAPVGSSNMYWHQVSSGDILLGDVDFIPLIAVDKGDRVPDLLSFGRTCQSNLGEVHINLMSSIQECFIMFHPLGAA